MLSEPLLVVARIAAALDDLSVQYAVGGSLASSVYGIPRATQDVDLIADLRHEHVEALTAVLAKDFYVDADMIADAIKRKSSFNVVHLVTMFKADVFVPGRDSWTREELKRARAENFEVEDGSVTIRFASPEDTLLHKLIWYKLGNEISERQWRDVLGIMKVQGASLDNSQLDAWADAIDVVALLKRARQECSKTQLFVGSAVQLALGADKGLSGRPLRLVAVNAMMLTARSLAAHAAQAPSR